MRIHLFEDETVGRLSPITLTRPAFNISCGSYRLLQLVTRLGSHTRWSVRPHLRSLLDVELPQDDDRLDSEEAVLLVNARLVPAASQRDRLEQIVVAGLPGLATGSDGKLAVALVPSGVKLPADDASPEEFERFLAGLDLPEWSSEASAGPTECGRPKANRSQAEQLGEPFDVFEWPHDVIRHHLAVIGENLEDRIRNGNYEESTDGVFSASSARLGPYVVTDTSQGPIILEDGASIGPYTFISGPAYIGTGARVIEHSAIKDAVSLGHTTKIGGEVEGSTIEPFTNKQHHGFLGHSYLGSWINLGAGTCNSDLKNTYGTVNLKYNDQKIATGMQFVGCVVGDYSKTAINTSIFTGKIVGVCSMLYGFITTNVPSFCNYGRSFGQVTEMPAQVVVAMQHRMFARRHVTQRPCDIQLLHDIYELTRHERQLTGEPLQL